MKQIFNFSAGPSVLPIKVLEKIKNELFNWNKLKISVMEISHRSPEFMQMAQTSEQDLRDLLDIPDYYKVLFLQGGARTQFSMIPMNLLKYKKNPDYINSGHWSYSAIKEAKKYCKPRIINVINNDQGLYSVKEVKNWSLESDSSYVHYCPNETINGLSIDEFPKCNDLTVVGDFSSTLLSQPIDINKFGIIYASAQKNIGISGLTLVIIRKSLLCRALKETPSTLNYKILSKNNSMFNTPPTFSWYVSSLVFKWIKSLGGLKKMHELNKEKANLLYQNIDQSSFYYNKIASNNRSIMNVTFELVNSNLNQKFLKESSDCGLFFLKGHKSIGGMRASLYNAMSLEGVKTLIQFMKNFVQRYG